MGTHMVAIVGIIMLLLLLLFLGDDANCGRLAKNKYEIEVKLLVDYSVYKNYQKGGNPHPSREIEKDMTGYLNAMDEAFANTWPGKNGGMSIRIVPWKIEILKTDNADMKNLRKKETKGRSGYLHSTPFLYGTVREKMATYWPQPDVFIWATDYAFPGSHAVAKGHGICKYSNIQGHEQWGPEAVVALGTMGKWLFEKDGTRKLRDRTYHANKMTHEVGHVVGADHGGTIMHSHAPLGKGWYFDQKAKSEIEKAVVRSLTYDNVCLKYIDCSKRAKLNTLSFSLPGYGKTYKQACEFHGNKFGECHDPNGFADDLEKRCVRSCKIPGDT